MCHHSHSDRYPDAFVPMVALIVTQVDSDERTVVLEHVLSGVLVTPGEFDDEWCEACQLWCGTVVSLYAMSADGPRLVIRTRFWECRPDDANEILESGPSWVVS